MPKVIEGFLTLNIKYPVKNPVKMELIDSLSLRSFGLAWQIPTEVLRAPVWSASFLLILSISVEVIRRIMAGMTDGAI